MSIKLFHACLLPFVGVGLTLFAGWVIENGLQLPIAIAATLGVIPLISKVE
jgi:hypothetical protein